MHKNIIISLVVGLVMGIGGTTGVVALASNAQTPTVTDHSTMSMADMNQELEGLSGDSYDKAFIEMMIVHHQGAIDMAELSATRARHDEVKQLSQAIILAQEEEIAQMKRWQIDWAYDTDETNQMMHGGH